jgi:hypothetical protein
MESSRRFSLCIFASGSRYMHEVLLPRSRALTADSRPQQVNPYPSTIPRSETAAALNGPVRALVRL